MAILTGDDALIASQNWSAPAKPGVLAQLVKGLTQPFVNLGKMAIETGREGAYTLGGLATGNVEQASGVGFKPLDEEFYKQYKADPVAMGLKTGLQIGSYAVPSGGNLLQTVGKGAIAGGMYGAGSADWSKPEEILKSGISGATTGGITAGVLYGAGKGLQKLKSLKNGKVQTSYLAKVDEAIKNGKGMGFDLGDGKVITSADRMKNDVLSNMRFEYISKNFKGQAQRDAMQELANELAKAGKDTTEEIVLKLINDDYGITPNTSIGSAVDELTGMKRVGKEMKAKALGIQQDLTESMPLTDQLKRSEALQNTLTKYSGLNKKYSGMPTQAKVEGLKADIYKMVTEKFKGNTTQIPVSEIVTDDLLTNVIGNTGTPITEKAAQQQVLSLLGKDLTDTISVQELGWIEKNLRQQAFKGGNTSRAAAAFVLHDKADDIMRSSIPEITPLYNDLSALHGVTKDMAKSYISQRAISSPMLLKGVGVPTLGIPQKITYGIGSMLEGGPNIQLPQNVTGALNKVGQIASNPLTTQIAAPVATQYGMVEQPEMIQQTQGLSQGGEMGDEEFNALYSQFAPQQGETFESVVQNTLPELGITMEEFNSYYAQQ